MCANIREKIENNIFSVIISVAIEVVGVTYSLVSYFDNQKLEYIKLQLEEEKNKYAQINRDVPGIKHFDVRSFLVKKASDKLLESGLTYFEQDHLIALKDDDYWKYEETTEEKLSKKCWA